ncbi:polyketide synthase dehydratase domain-containing protein, partial [Streptomyces sp. NRRL F-5065]|uniref:polyketide synthase dehydratase domain-containing protein n=1 Tax=Streptomyces sp. NRRL F-5065 TaxID=1463855 RepID=UPI0004BF92F1
MLRVSHAFHSPLMEPMLAEFGEVVAGLSFGAASVPVVSGVSGEVSQDWGSAEYWVRHVREAVRFADAVAFAESRGVTTFIEIGPDAVLSGMGQDCVQDAEAVAFVPLMRKGRSEVPTVVSALGELHVAGVGVDWARYFDGSGARRVDLPTYAFQRERYWLESVGAGDAGGLGQVGVDHPVLGARDEVGSRSVRVHSRPESGGAGAEWVLHADGVLGAGSAQAAPAFDLSAWPPPGAETVRTEDSYALLRKQGYAYGPVFQGLKAVWRRGDDIFAEVELPEQAHADAERFGLHPALLDSTMHALGVGEDVTGDEPTELPFSWTNVSLHAAGARALRVRISPQGVNGRTLSLANQDGSPVATIGGLTFRPVSVGQLGGSAGVGGLHEVVWRPLGSSA